VTDLHEHLLDHYGRCDRDNPPARNDCYWGTDDKGRRNGCLFLGWRGRHCPHWHPDEEQIAIVKKSYGGLE